MRLFSVLSLVLCLSWGSLNAQELGDDPVESVEPEEELSGPYDPQPEAPAPVV